MKQLLFGLFIVSIPFISNAQHNVSPAPSQHETLKREMENMQKTLQEQMNALQESISQLNLKLNESKAGRESEISLPEEQQEGNENFSIVPIPEIPEVPEIAEMPEMPEMPPFPQMPGVNEDCGRALEGFKDLNFQYSMPPIPEMKEAWSRALEEFRALNFSFEMPDFRFEMPEIPEIPMPEENGQYPEMLNELEQLLFDLDFPDHAPPSLKRNERRHKEFLEMLPFYQFFKS